MSVDDIVQLLLALALSFAVAGIAYQLMRLIGKLADTVQDMRKAVQNVSEASDMMLEDYSRIRKLLNTILSFVEDLETNLLGPLRTVGKLSRRFSKNKANTDTKPEIEDEGEDFD